MLADAGLEVRASSERALTASLGGEFEAIFVRAQDIPEFVADGAADAGITGWDLVSESERGLESRLDLAFGNCRIVVAVRDDSDVRTLEDIGAGVRVATVFPRLTRAFFSSAGRAVVAMHVMEGDRAHTIKPSDDAAFRQICMDATLSPILSPDPGNLSVCLQSDPQDRRRPGRGGGGVS